MKRLFIFTATLLLCCLAFSQESKTSNPKTESTIMMDTVGVKLPEFPNGVDSLISFLSTNLRYPKEAEKIGIEAKVIVGFVVGKDGSISNVKVEKSKLKNGLFNNITKKAQKCTPLFEEEAMRVVSIMPKWIPATKDGKPVSVLFHLPISFRLR
jgi:TonB family C-terminal domain